MNRDFFEIRSCGSGGTNDKKSAQHSSATLARRLKELVQRFQTSRVSCPAIILVANKTSSKANWRTLLMSSALCPFEGLRVSDSTFGQQPETGARASGTSHRAACVACLSRDFEALRGEAIGLHCVRLLAQTRVPLTQRLSQQERKRFRHGKTHVQENTYSGGHDFAALKDKYCGCFMQQCRTGAAT